jgi:hypothetical protein
MSQILSDKKNISLNQQLIKVDRTNKQTNKQTNIFFYLPVNGAQDEQENHTNLQLPYRPSLVNLIF